MKSNKALLRKLKASALASTIWRGHHMGRFTQSSHSTEYRAFCTKCGLGVWVNTHPAPNGIDISGEAVAMGCEKVNQ